MANLEKFLFYFLFFAIPFQMRKILYSPGWYFNEWQSISIYATDLILLALFIFWAVDKRHRKSFIHRYDYFLLGFLIAALVSVKNSSDFYSGFFLWLKLVEFAVFYFYLKSYAIHKFSFIKILYALVLGGLFQAVIAIGQFLKQGDLGLRLFGESVLGPHMTGIASFYNLVGEKVIRAYGATPHPNVLAAYLFLAIPAFYFVVFYAKPKHYDTPSYHSVYDSFLPVEASAQAGIYHKVIKYWWVWYPLMLFGFFFTFSRTIIFLWAVGFLIRAALVVFKSKFQEQFWRNPVLKNHLIRIISITLLTVIVFSFLYWPEVSARVRLSSEEEAVQLRVFYNKESLGGGINLFGIGLGDFTNWLMEKNPNLPRHVYQPVHNIYLLVYSEIGIIGFVLFLLFIGGLVYEFVKRMRIRKMMDYSFLLVIASILLMGLFDHFLLTIQQGRFIFWLSLALLTVLINHDNIRDTTTRR